MNTISGYRKMIGYTQRQMAKKLGITEGTYNRKENGKSNFKIDEMKIFISLVREEIPTINAEEIFFNNKPTKKTKETNDEFF